MIDDRTTHLNLSLPNAENQLSDDVGRLRDAITAIDTAINSLPTTGGVTASINAVIGAAPGALDTLVELAAALGNDASFASTVAASLASKAPLASPTFTGTVGGVTAAMVGLGSVNNTSDSDKPVSTLQATAIGLKQTTLVSGASIKTINGSSLLGAGDLSVGAFPIVTVSATSQAAASGTHYALTNIAATTVTLPASPASGDTVAITVCNSLGTNNIARNGQTIMGVAENMTIDSAKATVTLKFINSDWKLQ